MATKPPENPCVFSASQGPPWPPAMTVKGTTRRKPGTEMPETSTWRRGKTDGKSHGKMDGKG